VESILRAPWVPYVLGTLLVLGTLGGLLAFYRAWAREHFSATGGAAPGDMVGEGPVRRPREPEE
jgi:hypothetical protein